MDEPNLLPLKSMARRLGIKPDWLLAETEAGRIPHVKVGEGYLFNPAAVRSVLLSRAKGGSDAE